MTGADVVGPRDLSPIVLRPSPSQARTLFRERRQIAVEGNKLVVTNALGKELRFALTGPGCVRTIGYRVEIVPPRARPRWPSFLVLVSADNEVVAYGSCDPTDDDDFYWPSDRVQAFARAARLRYKLFAGTPGSAPNVLPAITRRSRTLDPTGIAGPVVYGVVALVLLGVVLLAAGLLARWMPPAAALATAIATYVAFITLGIRRLGRG